MSVFTVGVLPRDFVLGFGMELCVGGALIMKHSQLEQTLAIIIHGLATWDSMLSQTIRPLVMISTHSGIEVVNHCYFAGVVSLVNVIL